MKKSKPGRQFSRRGFLAGGALTVAAVVTKSNIVTATQSQGLKPEESRDLMRFVRDLFPHDRVDDTFYANAILPLQNESAKDPSVNRLLAEGIAQLNRLVQSAGGKRYGDLATETARLSAVRQIEHGAFFRKVYDTTIISLYNQPALWQKFGYEGPSSPKGGYLRRGFNDLNWL